MPKKVFIFGSYNSAVAYDTDAQAFFDRVTAAGGTTSLTEKTATNQLVLDLKSFGIWSSLKAIYPMVGSSSSACSQNLKSSSFTASFSGGWTFASTGITGNNTNAFMNSNFVPSTDASTSGFSFGSYPRNNNTTGTQVSGCFTTSTTSFAQHNLSNGNMFSGVIGNIISYTANPSTRTFIHRRTSSTFSQSYRNGTSLGSETNTASALPNINFYIGARNNGGLVDFYDGHEYAFYFLGLGLTNQNALDLTTSINTFQTSLSRNV